MSKPTTDRASLLRSASGDALTAALLEATPDELELVLDNPSLAEAQLLLMLRRSDLGSDLLRRVSTERRWIGAYPVKAAIVHHPHTPKVVSLNLAKYLFWRDLSKLCGNLQINASVRRMAEVLLRDRIREISLGERIALARLAPREAIKTLRKDHHERVVSALFENPRFTEEDAQVIATSRQTPPNILALLTRNDRWGSRHLLRLALVRNPRTPVSASISLLPSLVKSDLLALSSLQEVPPAVRSAAKRLLREREADSASR